jgi:AcrR family transcriptional regulator
MLSTRILNGMATTQRDVRSGAVAKAEATRRGLIEAGRKLFGKKGYAATSVDEVVKAAGVTKGALYHHFKDKDDLFRAVVEEVKLGITQRAADSYWQAADGIDPAQSLNLMCLAVIDAYLDPEVQRVSVLDARAVLDASTRRDLDTRYEVALLRGALRTAMRAGHMVSLPYVPLAHVLAGALVEGCALIAEAADRDTARAEVTTVITRLLDGLRPPT